MRIERVTAPAFGPLHDATLELAPGLTVVIGPNEAGKTSWHAALRVALTGLRRGRGRATAADAAFEQRHRPWDRPDRWEVAARLHLDDGRTIDIVQDLAGKVACAATDAVLGRDVSDEIMDGTPDASRWLGLNRDAFAATICVNQAQILAIADGATAAGLQEQMQRAASTRGTDATAAEARARITAFRRDHVGADRAGARGPLRTARERLQQAEQALAEARRRHREYLEAAQGAEAAQRTADVAEERVRMTEAAGAADAARAASRRAARAAELAERHPRPPRGAAHREAEAAAVASALEGWSARPRITPLSGDTSAELERALRALPVEPTGDTTPHPTVLDARRRLDLAAEGLRLHGRQGEVTAAPVAQTPAHPSRGAAPLLAAGAATLVVAVIVAWLGQLIAGGALALVGLALGAWGWRTRVTHRAAALSRVDAATAATVERRRAWERRRAELAAARDEAAAAVRAALLARGAAVSGDLDGDVAGYEVACRQRTEQAALAGRREALHQALDSRRAAEAGHAERIAAAGRAEAMLGEAAALAGVEATGAPDQLVERLRAWRRQHAAEALRRDQALGEWQELKSLLEDQTLEALREEADGLSARARELHALAGAADLSSLTGRADLDRLLALEREERDAAHRTAAGLAGGVEQMRRDMPDVAEAEERLDEARAELDRVERLATVLDETLRQLGAAEERVHRDLAPILADGIRRWLAAVTDGAYVDASVDPANLAVKVRESGSGRWRSALLLSQGTREQIYLLLRAAMAQSLVTTDETAPLLLDEVTAHADARRTERLLTVLHALAGDRQVVLFTHDERVAAWAERSLTEARDRLVRLSRHTSQEAAPSAGAVTSA